MKRKPKSAEASSKKPLLDNLTSNLIYDGVKNKRCTPFVITSIVLYDGFERKKKYDFLGNLPMDVIYSIIPLVTLDDYITLIAKPISKKIYQMTKEWRVKLKSTMEELKKKPKSFTDLDICDMSHENILCLQAFFERDLRGRYCHFNSKILLNLDFDKSYFKKIDRILMTLKLNTWRVSRSEESVFGFPFYKTIVFYLRKGREPDLKKKILLSKEDEMLEVADDEISKALHLACEYGRLHVLKQLLPRTNNLDDKLLHLASSKGYYKIVKCLLQDRRIEPTQADLLGALQYDTIRALKLLLNDPRIDPNIKEVGAFLSKTIAENKIETFNSILRVPRIDISKLGDILIPAVTKNQVDIVKMLLKGIDPSINHNLALITASYQGHFDIVKMLLRDSRVDPSDQDNLAIRTAASHGHAEIVKILINLTRVNPTTNNQEALISACENGHVDVVKVLLKDPRIDPSINNSQPIRVASGSKNPKVNIIKMLLKDERVDPSANNNEALENAKIQGNQKIVDLLSTRCR